MKRALGLMLVAAARGRDRIHRRDRRGGPGEEAGHVAQRGGQLVRLPARLEMDPALGSAYGYSVSYSPIGSGGGIAAVTARTVDFGASDAPLSSDQMAACKGCVQVPWALSATSIPYNLPGLNCVVRLTGPILADIYLGSTTKWNDPAITKVNPKCTLPDTKITPVYRSDNSGTSYNFTDYLSSVNGRGRRSSAPA